MLLSTYLADFIVVIDTIYFYVLTVQALLLHLPFFFFIFKSFIEIELIYNVEIISAIQPSDSVMHVYTSILSQILLFYPTSN